MEEKVGTGVLGKARGHRLDDTEFICHLRHVGKQVADPGTALATLPEGPGGLQNLSDGLELLLHVVLHIRGALDPKLVQLLFYL